MSRPSPSASRYLSQKQPHISAKEPHNSAKYSILFCKRGLYFCKRALCVFNCATSCLLLDIAPLFLGVRVNFHNKAPYFNKRAPYFRKRAPYFRKWVKRAPYFFKRAPYFLKRAPHFHKRAPYICKRALYCAKEPHIFATEPNISAKEPHNSANDSMIPQKSPNNACSSMWRPSPSALRSFSAKEPHISRKEPHIFAVNDSVLTWVSTLSQRWLSVDWTRGVFHTILQKRPIIWSILLTVVAILQKRPIILSILLTTEIRLESSQRTRGLFYIGNTIQIESMLTQCWDSHWVNVDSVYWDSSVLTGLEVYSTLSNYRSLLQNIVSFIGPFWFSLTQCESRSLTGVFRIVNTIQIESMLTQCWNSHWVNVDSMYWDSSVETESFTAEIWGSFAENNLNWGDSSVDTESFYNVDSMMRRSIKLFVCGLSIPRTPFGLMCTIHSERTYSPRWYLNHMYVNESYGVAMMIRLLKNVGLLCEYSLFHRAILQERPMFLGSLLIVATPYHMCDHVSLMTLKGIHIFVP